jgi:anaphase-promoting complex subunit 5
VLFDVKKLLEEQSVSFAVHHLSVIMTVICKDQPLSVAFKRIVESIGLYDHYIEAQGHQTVPLEQWSQHAVQAAVWRIAGELYYRDYQKLFIKETVGRSKLAAVESNIVTAFTNSEGNNNERLNVTFARAYEVST